MRRARSRPPSDRPQTLAAALTDPACYGGDVHEVRVAETHISWVFLTGRYAYKVKKPVKLPFLDFSTLARRHHFCREELRLNRRLAPDLYLDVVPIGGSSSAPRVGQGPAIEYAVKMRQFGADARLDQKLAADAVSPSAIREFASKLARFHRALPSLHTDPEGKSAQSAARDNIAALERYAHGRQHTEIAALRSWTEKQCAALTPVFAERTAAGAERECHGDMHLENLLWHDGAIVAYDALEFDPHLRDIDVMSEASFVAMDLMAHRRADLAYVFLNRYLEEGGDYAGIDVLRFYLVYRALVRAKVRAIKAGPQRHAPTNDPYLATARTLTQPRTPLLLLTHGLSGSGKTTLTEDLVGPLQGLRVRSDLERKRLHGLSADARTGSAVGQGLYGAEATRQTYDRLAAVADRALRNGFNVIVDATFLRRAERWAFRQIAEFRAARFAILDCTAPADELRRRIRSRSEAGREASEATVAVLEQQLATREPLDGAELRSTVHVDTRVPVNCPALAALLSKRR